MLLTLDILLILHFVGLMLGAGGGIGATVVMRHALSLPQEQGDIIRTAGPALSGMSIAGLLLMLLTGIALWAIKYEFAFASMPAMFWVKMVFVTTLTIASVMIQLTHGRVKRGDTAAASRLPRFGPMAGISALLAVLFAVLAFH
jgi:hypothetical protein